MPKKLKLVLDLDIILANKLRYSNFEKVDKVQDLDIDLDKYFNCFFMIINFHLILYMNLINLRFHKLIFHMFNLKFSINQFQDNLAFIFLLKNLDKQNCLNFILLKNQDLYRNFMFIIELRKNFNLNFTAIKIYSIQLVFYKDTILNK